MPCPPCRNQVPRVSVAVANEVLRRLSPVYQQVVKVIVMQWVTRPEPGLRFREGITGQRRYTVEEADEIAQETGLVAGMPCPFKLNGGCLLNGLPPQSNGHAGRGPAQYGWLPTLLARELEPRMLESLARDGNVPDAKLALLTRTVDFPTTTPGVLVH